MEGKSPAKRQDRVDFLRQRLARGRSSMPSPMAKSKGVASAGSGRASDRSSHKDLTHSPHWAEVPGDWLQTPNGPLHKIQAAFGHDHRHGQAPLGTVLTVPSGHLSVLTADPQTQDLRLANALFIDTETTGLAGGAGTYAFLLGLGWFEDDRFNLVQLLLRRPGQEVPILHFLAERMQKASCLVSYNGKSYDLPLLRNRFILNRVKMPKPPPHIDLLHCCRRVFKRRLDNMRLTTVEREVLGFERIDDVGGAMIPELYFSYLKGAHPKTLCPVVEHNAHDIVALAAVLGRLLESLQMSERGDDSLCIAELWERAGEFAHAQDWAERAASSGNGQKTGAQALILSARQKKRLGHFAQSADTLHRACEMAEPGSVLRAEAHLMLAKIYEHQLKDPQKAMVHALQSRRMEDRQSHHKRIARLKAKQCV